MPASFQARVDGAPMERLRGRRGVARAAVAGLLLTLAGSACSELPQTAFQRVSIGLEGGGRDIAATFDYPCARSTDPIGDFFYEPEASGFLAVAANRQALLLLSGDEERDSPLCRFSAQGEAERPAPSTPYMLWIDNVDAPGRADLIWPHTLAFHRAHFLEELAVYEHEASEDRSAEPVRGARARAVAGTFRTITQAAGPGTLRMLSPASLTGVARFRGEAEAAAFNRLLGEEIAPGVRRLALCDLARTEDGAALLRTHDPDRQRRCPSRAPVIAAGALRFGAPAEMKLRGDGMWLGGTGPMISAVSYVRDDAAAAQPLPARGGLPAEGQSEQFWRRHVRGVTWLVDMDRRVPLPDGGFGAYYDGRTRTMIFLGGGVDTIFLKDPSTW